MLLRIINTMDYNRPVYINTAYVCSIEKSVTSSDARVILANGGNYYLGVGDTKKLMDALGITGYEDMFR